MAPHQAFQRPHQGARAAHRKKDPVGAFQIMDQGINAGGVKRRAAEQQGLDRKGPAQLVVLQVLADPLPDALVASEPGQSRDLLHHGHELVKGLMREAGEADLKHGSGVGHQRFIAGAIGRTDTAYLGQRVGHAAAVVKPVAIGEMKPVPGVERPEFNMVPAPLIEQCKQLIEQKRGRDHRGTGVMAITAALKDLRPAAEGIEPFHQPHLQPQGAEPERARDAAEAGADDQRGLHQAMPQAEARPLSRA